MRVLVTGGASVVGSHLCERLLADGHEVLAVDDLSTGSFANVAHLAREARFSLVEHDVASPFDAQVEAVYHLALPSTPRRRPDEVTTAMTCVAGTKHVLDVAAARGARVVMASSAARAGEGLRCAEAIARAAGRAGVDVRFVRVAAAYGPRMAPDDGQLVTRLVLEGLRGTPISVVDATARLTWMFDAVETLVRAMAHDARVPPVVAPWIDARGLEIASAVGEATGTPVAESPAGLEPEPARSPGATLTEAFPAALVFGLSPSVELAAGIRQVVESFARRIGGRAAVRAGGVDPARRVACAAS